MPGECCSHAPAGRQGACGIPGIRLAEPWLQLITSHQSRRSRHVALAIPPRRASSALATTSDAPPRKVRRGSPITNCSTGRGWPRRRRWARPWRRSMPGRRRGCDGRRRCDSCRRCWRRSADRDHRIRVDLAVVNSSAHNNAVLTDTIGRGRRVCGQVPARTRRDQVSKSVSVCPVI